MGIPAPLYRDPIFDGAADPTVIWNRTNKSWWILYTNRRAWSPPLDDMSWVHGTDIGVAETRDGGITWTYRGIVQGLGLSDGRDTFWAPEVIDDGDQYHMYVSVIDGVPTHWDGHERHIQHYVSRDLLHWTFVSTLALGSDRVIDAAVYRERGGTYRMWYKDESRHNHTYTATSTDLATWTDEGLAVGHYPHEGPNVFRLEDWYWMLVDEWRGQRVLRSADLRTWEPRNLILDEAGERNDDGGVGFHADVVVVGEDAWVFYFTHPERTPGSDGRNVDYRDRRSSLQVARARVVDDELCCDRNSELAGPILPIEGP